MKQGVFSNSSFRFIPTVQKAYLDKFRKRQDRENVESHAFGIPESMKKIFVEVSGFPKVEKSKYVGVSGIPKVRKEYLMGFRESRKGKKFYKSEVV